MAQTKHHSLISILSLLAVVTFVVGCRSSKQVAADEGFFEPLKSVNWPAAPKPSKVISTQKPLPWDQLVDSLVKRQREQERRIGALTGQLQLLETSRQGDKADSSRAAGKQADKTSRPNAQPTRGKYAEILRLYEAGQYKAALEGFQGLLRSGVPKDIEDQYHYMIGMCHFKLRQFDLAAASLKIVTKWKRSRLRADAYFALGQIYKQLGASRQAKSMFHAALRASPKADLAKAARKELKELAAKK